MSIFNFKATKDMLGLVKPDNTTITIDEDGTIHGQSATPAATIDTEIKSSINAVQNRAIYTRFLQVDNSLKGIDTLKTNTGKVGSPINISNSFNRYSNSFSLNTEANTSLYIGLELTGVSGFSKNNYYLATIDGFYWFDLKSGSTPDSRQMDGIEFYEGCEFEHFPDRTDITTVSNGILLVARRNLDGNFAVPFHHTVISKGDGYFKLSCSSIKPYKVTYTLNGFSLEDNYVRVPESNKTNAIVPAPTLTYIDSISGMFHAKGYVNVYNLGDNLSS